MISRNKHCNSNVDKAGENESESVKFELVLTDEAFYALTRISSNRLFEHVVSDLEIIETCPDLGKAYDPAYDSYMPPFECQVFFCEHLGIYYCTDKTTAHITVFAIVDQRRDPQKPFSAFEYGVEGI